MRATSCALALLVSLAIAGLAAAQDTAPGLLVRLYDVGEDMRWLPELVAGEQPNAVKVVPTLDLDTERKDFEGLESNFLTEVVGRIKIEQPGKYAFRLISDDGAQLWLDGRLLIDNDRPHPPTPKDGEIALQAGPHDLQILHFQGGGGAQLTLLWNGAAGPPPSEPEARARGDVAAGGSPAEAGFELIPAALLSHPADASQATVPGKKKIIPALRRGRPGDGSPLAGVPPSVSMVVLGSGMYGVQDDSPFACRTLEICTALPKEPRGSFIFLPPGEPPGNEVQRVRLQMRAAPSGEHRITGEIPAAELCLTPVAAAVRGGRDLYRVVPEPAGAIYQGCVFRFAGGFPGPIAYMVGALPGGTVVEATVEKTEDYPLGRAICFFRRTERIAFEIASVRVLQNGFELEFTKPLDPRVGSDPESYYIEQWPFDAQNGVAPHRDGVVYPVKSASVSPDRKQVFLEIENLKSSHVVYIRLLPPCLSADGELPWSTEAWYTLNVIPQDRSGQVLPPPAKEPQNILTADEKQAGWRLLFDGQTTKGWHGYRKQETPSPALPLEGGGSSFPDGWQVSDGCLVRVAPAGDIITDDEFGDFELSIEWRVSPGGNGGIMYRVTEDHDYPWQTGPEYQILDNAEHADGRNPLTSAASCYALYAPPKDVTVPVGLFNQTRILLQGSHVEHWLNGVKVVAYELGSPEWEKLVAASKFGQMPDYGRRPKGKIDLQDHGDKAWYRNIKVRALP